MKEQLENLDKARKEFEQQGRPPALLEAFLNGDQNRLLSLISHLNLTCRDHYEPAHKPVFCRSLCGLLSGLCIVLLIPWCPFYLEACIKSWICSVHVIKNGIYQVQRICNGGF